jgi:hypothetical protein
MAPAKIVLQYIMRLLAFAASQAMPQYYLAAGLVHYVARHTEKLVHLPIHQRNETSENPALFVRDRCGY